ncbi:MAG: hypothetical protein JWP18_136 [Solirubrobacterales bacterium]|jgi:hypothetical protein|nr:hypothetical protein [Solirubrobacterales bacterium]
MLDHLDTSAITLSKRVVTQTIAADLHDRHGAAVCAGWKLEMEFAEALIDVT